jgi:cysteine-rich repeat protein
VLIAVACAWGCVGEGVVPCGAISCPANDICTAAGKCASRQDVAACAALADGDACMSATTPNGACHGGACAAIVCGDGVVDPGEVCDDGNTVDGDGCSATCNSNETCGNAIVDTTRGEDCDSGRPGLDVAGCSSTCKLVSAQWDDISPVPIGKRVSPLVAYDSARKVVVAFGGYDETGYLSDTWEFDGTTWARAEPIVSPPAFAGAAMTYDAARGVVVLHGGSTAMGYVSETWTWDGVTWKKLQPIHTPPAHYGPGLAYDPKRERVFLFGGGDSEDAWEWDGTDWTEVTQLGKGPQGRYYAQMEYDALDSVIVVYGGYSDQARALYDTWTWDGTTWTQLAGPHPTSSSTAAISYDTGRQKLVLAGGDYGGAETWEWDKAGGWKQVATTGLPSRCCATMAYDVALGKSVLFAGFGTDALADTWMWDGAQWTQPPPLPLAPTQRGSSGMAYDERRGEIVLFGGYDGSITYADTWIWSLRGGWRQVASGSSPSARNGALMAYDRMRGEVVLFGGYGGPALADTWTWDGTSWTQKFPAHVPPARDWCGAVYDDANQRIVIFGGYTTPSTWAWDGTDWHDLAPPVSLPDETGQAFAYDVKRKRIVAFGYYYTDDRTWEFDGTTWADVSPAVSPPGRSDAVMYYDPIAEKVVMYGGLALPLRGDTWEWDGTTWKLRAEVNAVPLWGAAIAYDAVQRRAIVFGGFDNFVTSQRTLAFEYTSPTVPKERCLSAAVDDDGDGLAGCADPDCWGRCTPGCLPGTTCDPALPHCGDGTCGPIEDHLICPADCP